MSGDEFEVRTDDPNGKATKIRYKVKGNSATPISDVEDLPPVELSAESVVPGPVPFDVVHLETVPPEAVVWMWDNYLPLGAIVGLAGSLGTGKTLLMCDIIHRLTTGEKWPDGAVATKPRNAIIMSSEDRLEDTMVPRLLAAGADLRRVKSIPLITTDDKGKKRPVMLSQDIERLEATIKKVGDVGLIGIDSVLGFMGSSKVVDTHVAADVRAVLGPMADIAQRYQLTELLLTHRPKAQTKAENSFIGSQAWMAQARAAYLTIREADKEGRETGRILFAGARPPAQTGMPPTLAYRIVSRLIEPGSSILAPYIDWESGAVTVSADQALQAEKHQP
jgi:putative DNA primase/helicase